MKTPREILLNRHRSAQPKLDDIREKALAALAPVGGMVSSAQASSPWPSRAAWVIWRELILPCRRIWAGLAAVWMVLLVLNLPGGAGSTPRFEAKSTPPVRDAQALLLQQREMLAQFFESSPPSPAILRRTPAPHSELPQTITFV